MEIIVEILKAILFGIVEGITEWLPISSTGHMILLDEFVKLNVSDAFYEMFQVVIQLGAIGAVILLFFHKLNPFSPKKDVQGKRDTWQLWFKVVAAVLPSAVIGLLLDDWMDAHLYNYVVVCIALVVYGVDGLDEISVSDITLCTEVRNGKLQDYVISPEEFGLKRSPHDELLGGGPQENAAITRAVLSGQQKGARRDAVLLNAGAGLYTVKRVKTIEDGMEMAAQAIDSGEALRTLDRYVSLTGAVS